MKMKKEMIAMLLAGGQGSRLGVLTSKVAKPAPIATASVIRLASLGKQRIKKNNNKRSFIDSSIIGETKIDVSFCPIPVHKLKKLLMYAPARLAPIPSKKAIT